MVKADWFKRTALVTNALNVSIRSSRVGIQRTKYRSSADYSVCTTWGVRDQRLYCYMYCVSAWTTRNSNVRSASNVRPMEQRLLIEDKRRAHN